MAHLAAQAVWARRAAEAGLDREEMSELSDHQDPRDLTDQLDHRETVVTGYVHSWVGCVVD